MACFFQPVLRFSPILFVRIRIRNKSGSESTKLLKTDLIWVRIHNTKSNLPTSMLILSAQMFFTRKYGIPAPTRWFFCIYGTYILSLMSYWHSVIIYCVLGGPHLRHPASRDPGDDEQVHVRPHQDPRQARRVDAGRHQAVLRGRGAGGVDV